MMRHEQVNRQTALWRNAPREVTEEQYHDFYKQFTLEAEEPLLHLHVVTDAPVQVYSILLFLLVQSAESFRCAKKMGSSFIPAKSSFASTPRISCPNTSAFRPGCGRF
jgi:HSP90 family molecular chaperone